MIGSSRLRIAMLPFAFIAVRKHLIQLTGSERAGITQFDKNVQSFLNDGALAEESRAEQ